MDAQSTVADSAALIALVQSLARLVIAHQQPRTAAGADDCFALRDLAELTIELATMR
jgi:hypothetical protein